MFVIYIIVDPKTLRRIDGTPDFFEHIEDLEEWAENQKLEPGSFSVWALAREDYQAYKISQTMH